MSANDREPFRKLGSNEQCEACGHKGWCMQSVTTIWCMRNPEGAYSTTTDKAGYTVYLHRRTGVPAAAPYRSERREERANWSSADPLSCTYLYTMLATEFARPSIPAAALAADAARFGAHAEAVRQVADVFYLADPEDLLRRIAAEGRTQDAKNAGILYPDDHKRAGQLVGWLRERKIYAWREGGQVRDLRGRAIGPSTHKVLSLAGSREARGADGVWYQQRNLAACDGHIRIAGGHEKADALNVAGLPAVGSNEGQASDAMIAALTAAGVILATIHIDGEDPKPDKVISEGQRLGLAIGDRFEAAGIAVRIAEPGRSPGEPKLDADSLLRDHGPEALRDIDARAVPLSLFRRRLGINPADHDPEHTKRLQEELREARARAALPSAMMQFDRSAAFPKAAKPVAKAVTLVYSQLKSAGKIEADGYAPTSLPAIAEVFGGSKDAAGDQLKRIAKMDVGIHKRVEDRPFRRIDADGQVVVERRKVLLVKVDNEPVDQLVKMADYAKPEDAEGGKTWGGKRIPCPKCGGTSRRTVTSCADCGLVISERVTDVADNTLTNEEIAEALRAEQRPDEPRDDAPSVPPTVVEPIHIPFGVVDAQEEDDPLPPEDACWHRYSNGSYCATSVPYPRRRDRKAQYCDAHQSDAIAQRPHASPTFTVEDTAPSWQQPAPVSQPAPPRTSVYEVEPIDWGAVPLGTERQAGVACHICGAGTFERPGKPVLCGSCLDAMRAELLLLGGDVAAGGG